MLLKREWNLFGSQIKSFVGTSKVEAVEVNKMKLGEPDSSKEAGQKLKRFRI